MREVLFVAGETSGDLHAAGVASELRRSAPERPLAGIGGRQMSAAGVQLLEHVDHLAVMGFAEVLRTVPRHRALLRQMEQRIRSGSVGLVILVDYPGFNMKVAAAARSANVPVLYYVTPQVWAWGANRLSALARTVTRAAVILPFEEPLLRAHGIDAHFVGHPLLDRARTLPNMSEARRSLGLDADRPTLALFPGSRRQEIRRHLAPFVATARRLERDVPGLQVVVSGAPGLELDPVLCPYPIVRDQSFVVWRAATAALSKSGTSTLEAAVAACPLVIGYRTSSWTYVLARRLVTIPHIGLVNVVAERQVAPELVQGALQPERAAAALRPLLSSDSPERRTMLDGLALVRSRLGTPGAASRVAAMALDLAL